MKIDSQLRRLSYDRSTQFTVLFWAKVFYNFLTHLFGLWMNEQRAVQVLYTNCFIAEVVPAVLYCERAVVDFKILLVLKDYSLQRFKISLLFIEISIELYARSFILVVI